VTVVFVESLPAFSLSVLSLQPIETDRIATRKKQIIVLNTFFAKKGWWRIHNHLELKNMGWGFQRRENQF
jgi:hypothetical protein